MHKRLAIILAVVTIIGLCGCGKSEEKTQPVSSTELAPVENSQYKLIEPETEAPIETDDYSSYSQLNRIINKITSETE